MSHSSKSLDIDRLGPGDHVCCLYQTEQEHREVLTPFLVSGLKAGDKIVYIVDIHTAETILNYLGDEYIDPHSCQESGQLAILDRRETYLRGGEFRPDAMIDMLKEEAEGALEEGYRALRVTGEMSWALRRPTDPEPLIYYENKLNEFFSKHQALALCQYDMNKFEPQVLMEVLRTHPYAVIGTEMYENFYYVPPEQLLKKNRKAEELDAWIENLRETKRRKNQLKATNRHQRMLTACNQILIRAQSQEGLLEDICETIVNEGGYRFAWVGQVDESGEKGIDTVARAGRGEGFLDTLDLAYPSGEGDLRSTRDAIREGERAVERILKDTEDCETWREEALDRDYRTSVALPLEVGGEVWGALTIYSGQVRDFDSPELDLLGELAADLSYGIETLHTEEKVRRLSKFRERVIDDAQVWLNVHDLDGNILTWNRAAEEISGYPEEEVLGSNEVWEWLYPSESYREEVMGKVEQIKSGLDVKGYRTTIRAKSGEKRIISWNSHRMEEEQPPVVVTIGQDITERVETRRKLKESERRYRTVFQTTGTAMIVIEPDTTISLANRRTEELTGYSRQEIEGKISWEDLVARDEKREEMRRYHRARREDSGQAPSQYEFQLKDKSGNIRDVVITIDMIPGTEKSLASLMEVTDLKEAERALTESFIDLAETTSRVVGIRDPYTKKHEQEVARLAKEMGRLLGFDEDRRLGLYIGGLLHDIGKIAIPETVLTKPGELTDIEWDLIRSHPQVGYDAVLNGTDFPWPVAEMTHQHHERLDGSGYPQGLEGEEISLEVRILAVCDVVEAMSSRRPYRKSRTRGEVVDEIESGSGTRYDSRVVDLALEMIEDGKVNFD